MNTPVSFEISKLIKEKGFDENCRFGYSGLFEPHHIGLIEFSYSQQNSELLETTYSAPTIAEVVMWLYEKHGIWVGVQPNEPYVDDDWCFTIFKDLKNNNSLEGYDSPIEAYEAAIEYVLKNLI